VSAEWYASVAEGVNATRANRHRACCSSGMSRHSGWRALGIGVNVALRATIVGVVFDALVRPNDPRYAGKGIGKRGLVLVASTALVPVLHGTTRRGDEYPLATDNLYLSISALDLAGNYLDLYNRFAAFDLIPHFHGTGAASIVVANLTRRPLLAGVGLAQIGHVVLEAQEYYSDVFFGLHNVRGTWDTINDLLAGAAGSLTYAGIAALARRR
jgi:hypothetical protein